MHDASISVLIVNWNAADDLCACLASLKAQTDTRFETVVVDNGSHDDSVARARRGFPAVRVVELPGNAGFAEACNRGLSESSGAWIALLNNDACADARWIEALRAAARRAGPSIGMIQSRIVLRDPPPRLNSTGVLVRPNGTFVDRDFGAPAAHARPAGEVFCPSAGAALYRRSMLEALRLPSGVFDRTFFMYFEDVDLGWRARLAGFEAVYAPEASVVHAFHASARRRERDFVRLQCTRNRMRTLLKNASRGLVLRAAPRTGIDAAWTLLFHGPRALGRLVAAARDGLRQRGDVDGLIRVPRRRIERRFVGRAEPRDDAAVPAAVAPARRPPGGSDEGRDDGVRAEARERGYAERVAQERRFFRGPVAARGLPPAFHYWTNKYLRPEVARVYGVAGPAPIYAAEGAAAFEAAGSRRMLSIGSGRGDVEVAIALALRERGERDFRIDCLELDPELCEAGRRHAEAKGVTGHLEFVEADMNRFEPAEPGGYAAVVANEILHHVVELERLFAAVRRALAPGGRFLIRDMVGRNGHRCWPELRRVVDEIWAALPRRLTFDHVAERFCETYPDRDCSTEGFEGIRSQDVLPLLLKSFHFEKFVGFGGLVERFTGRVFGPSYRIEEGDAEDDRALVDLIYLINKSLIDAGAIKPTQVIATAVAEPATPVCGFGWTPEHCLRRPDA